MLVLIPQSFQFHGKFNINFDKSKLKNIKKDHLQRIFEEKAAIIQQDSSARVIQRIFRGYLARKNYKQTHRAQNELCKGKLLNNQTLDDSNILEKQASKNTEINLRNNQNLSKKLS